MKKVIEFFKELKAKREQKLEETIQNIMNDWEGLDQ